ncbi:MAG: alpha-2-macroglobulin family protein [Edaphocola sp.]
MQKIVALALCLILPILSLAQNKKMNDKYANDWQKADSLMQRNLPQSAQKIVEKILADATAANEQPQMIKANLYLLATQQHTDESDTSAIANATQQTTKTTDPVAKATWQSIAAQLYWDYYQNNRWAIMNRSQLAENTATDIGTWTAVDFFKKISALYLASIEPKQLLLATPVEKYAPVIVDGANTRQLRPSMYDLLVFRAITYFQNDEKDVVDAANKFEIGDALWFDDADKFAEAKVKVADTNSLHFKALQLYQEIIRAHLNDKEPDALIDADLQRLYFVYHSSVNPDKDALYLAALKKLASAHQGLAAAAQVEYLIQKQLAGTETTVYDRGENTKPRTPSRNLPEIAAKLEQISKQFPESEGGVNAYNLLQQLKEQSLSGEAEEAYIPNQNIKVLLRYKNVANAYLKLYAMPGKPLLADNYRKDLVEKIIAGNKPIKTWQQPLPGSTDMEQHSTEIKIDALGTGTYLLVLASKDNTYDSTGIVSAVRFQVSNLSFVMQNNGDKNGIVLHRKTGYPVAHAQITFWARKYNNKTYEYEAKKQGTATTDKNGVCNIPHSSNNDIAAITITQESDVLKVGGYFNTYRSKETDNNRYHTFFFTDRAIYRPGQTIYFKGIIVSSEEKNRKNTVVANEKTSVSLYDANYQKIATQEFTTNEYGSFSGKFTAPETGLTGNMHLQDNYGTAYFSVEEYKRPKFFVDFDTLKDAYALNETVQVKGFAKAFAGSNIDGAKVKYRVVRNARFPYYWCFYRWGMPSSPEMEITNGETTTKEDGSFTVGFQTLPDRSVDPQTLPIFGYTVYADITDINGETRSGNVAVNSGYRSLQINVPLNEDSRPSELDTITVQTQNLNGIFTPATVKVSIARLLFPGFLRKRLWSMPDQFAMNESEFRATFPLDEYKAESNHLNWKEGKTIFEKIFTTTADGRITIPESTWHQNGWYVIKVSAKDAQGNEVLEQKYTHVWMPGKKEPTQKDLIAYTEQDSYQPGETAEVWIATAAENPYLLQRGSRTIEDKNPAKIVLTEADRGGMATSWLYVFENRVYAANKRIDVPWSNKDLQIAWATHRDKLQPGAREEWTLTIKGEKKEQVAAELLAGMYDASLDALRPHRWDWQKLFPSVYASNGWNSRYGFGSEQGVAIQDLSTTTKEYDKGYDMLLSNPNNPVITPRRMYDALSSGQGITESTPTSDYESFKQPRGGAVMAAGGLRIRGNSSVMAAGTALAGAAPGIQVTNGGGEPAPEPLPKGNKQQEPALAVRSNLNETAFFFPQMAIDKDGNVQFKFTMPEALTEWKLMAFAHTKDWKTGYMDGKVKTQKDLMVVPNLPRFFRQNDDIAVSSKITNLSNHALSGKAAIELVDALTMQPIALASFQQKTTNDNSEPNQTFTVPAGQSTTVSWCLHIPESRYTPVVVRIVATAGGFSDGEENTLPLITNRTLVTETLPLPIRGNDEKTFSFDKLINANSSSLSNKSLTVEFTGNPAWYAVQALPYLMEYPYECAEQTFNRFYANALAAHIVAQSPKVAAIFDQWKNIDTAALQSNLQKNQELKSALLEETPWVLDAQNESEQKRRMAQLFATHKLAKDLKNNLDKLTQMQLSQGGFPWFKGMYSNRYITQYIVTGLLRLQHLGVAAANAGDANNILAKALPYLDDQLNNDYGYLVKNKANLNQQQIGYTQIQYLYMRSFAKENHIPTIAQKAFDYYKNQASAYWPSFNPYMQGHIALALGRYNDTKAAQQIMASLKENAIVKEEMGMYWKNMPRGYWWHEAPIEAQSLLIEAFGEVSKDTKAVDDMKVWLLKQKQTQNWATTKATADAIYALLLQGSDWLGSEPAVTIQVGNKTIKSTEIKTEAGTGYFKEVVPGPEVKPEMGHVKVQVEKAANTGTAWGAVYWQYFENMDKITAATAAPLSIEKQLYIERNSATGPVLTEIKETNALHIGDKVKVRIILHADRDMEYVHLKDMRAACFEPVNVLSQYRYQGGLGYYESTKDVSTNFFFDYLRKGTYVFEYPVFVTAKGKFSNGISTIQCMYAPEFGSHSAGLSVKVE